MASQELHPNCVYQGPQHISSWPSTCIETDHTSDIEDDIYTGLSREFNKLKLHSFDLQRKQAALRSSKPKHQRRRTADSIDEDHHPALHRVDSGFLTAPQLADALNIIQDDLRSFMVLAQKVRSYAAWHNHHCHVPAGDEHFSDAGTLEPTKEPRLTGDWIDINPALGFPRHEEELPEGVKQRQGYDMLQSIGVPVQEDADQREDSPPESPGVLPYGIIKDPPAVLRALYKKIGRLAIQQERWSDLYIHHGEELTERNLKLDQGEVVEPSDKVFNKRFRRREQKILDKMEILTSEVEELERKCFDAGLPIPERWSPLLQEMPQGSDEGEAQERDDTQSNSRPPSPGSSQRVTGWLRLAVDPI